MGTSKEQIRRWLEVGKELGATHTIIVCDTFDHGDYPVHVYADAGVRKVFEDYNGKNMQRVMEVYHLGMDLDAQLAEHRAMHFNLEELPAPLRTPNPRWEIAVKGPTEADTIWRLPGLEVDGDPRHSGPKPWAYIRATKRAWEWTISDEWDPPWSTPDTLHNCKLQAEDALAAIIKVTSLTIPESP